MNMRVRIMLMLAYASMIGLTALVWYVLGNLLLQLPTWYTLIFAGLSVVAVTVGFAMAIKQISRKK